MFENAPQIISYKLNIQNVVNTGREKLKSGLVIAKSDSAFQEYVLSIERVFDPTSGSFPSVFDPSGSFSSVFGHLLTSNNAMRFATDYNVDELFDEEAQTDLVLHLQSNRPLNVGFELDIDDGIAVRGSTRVAHLNEEGNVTFDFEKSFLKLDGAHIASLLRHSVRPQSTTLG